MTSQGAILYEDSYIRITESMLRIKWYYFPFGSKDIEWKQIKRVEVLPISGEGISGIKHWGMALSPVWWHCDWQRFSRAQFVKLDLGSWVKVGITCDDVQTASALIKTRTT